MNQTPLRVTSWSLKWDKRCGTQESSDILESTRGPSRKPAWAATINIAASVISVCTNLVSGENDTSWDAGIVPAAIGDRVWLDQDNNGLQNGTEPGVPGITVELLGHRRPLPVVIVDHDHHATGPDVFDGLGNRAERHP